MFKEQVKVLFEKIGSNKKMCLATSKDDIVTARFMSVITVNQKLYFQTDKNFNKYQQIIRNPNIALSYSNISITGKCCEIGRPMDEKNYFFACLFEKYYKGSFDSYSHLESERLFEVIPTTITVWDYDKYGKAYREYYDFNEQTYKIEYYLS